MVQSLVSLLGNCQINCCDARTTAHIQKIVEQAMVRRWPEEDPVINEGHEENNATLALSFSPSGDQLALTHQNHSLTWIDAASGKLLKRFTGHARSAWSLQFHPKLPNLLVSGSLDGTFRTWDVETGKKELFIHHFLSQVVTSLAFHPLHPLLLVATKASGPSHLYFWTVGSEAPTPRLSNPALLRWLQFTPKGNFLLIGEQKSDDNSEFSIRVSVYHWDIPSMDFDDQNELFAVDNVVAYTTNSVHVSPCEQYLALVCCGSVTVISLSENPGRILLQFPNQNVKVVSCLRFSPTGRYLVAGYGDFNKAGKSNLSVFDVEMGEVVQSRLGITSENVNCLEFHPLPGWGLAFGTDSGKCFRLP